MTDLESLTYVQFAPLEGTAFQVGEPLGAELRLHSVRMLGHRRAQSLRDPFSLLFRGPSGLRIPQGIQKLTNATLGELEIFITQVGDGPDGSDFEAIFT